MTAARWPPTRHHLLVRGMCEIHWWRMFHARLAARCCSGCSLHHVTHERMSSTPFETPGSLSPMAVANVVAGCKNSDPRGSELCLRRAKSGETLVRASCGIDVQIVRYTSVLGRKTNRTISQVVPLRSLPLDTWT